MDTASVGACAVVRVSIVETVAPPESWTVKVIEKVPTSSVAPEMVALGVLEVRVSPVGKPVANQVYGVTPPLAATVAE